MSSTTPASFFPSPLPSLASAFLAVSGKIRRSNLPDSSRATRPWSSQWVLATWIRDEDWWSRRVKMVAIRGWD